ncbi:squalene--hopene cyclase [Blastopirellula sp. J2-11]|uniref:prenyltransferase/squalene oxidase repeat-containing protein n=1 Tax=Blastopirellula sp. J2-11 TaxID=2943192 RepID=UPI0021C8CE80|nr:prenyltransferase/squalene oxidase repeat-containing protein [Blastopirellula sp. J2-11]UUO09211.1 squalene--hopene cyclase [Blastopirellula sp. J2-11]
MDLDRLQRCYAIARDDLLTQRNAQGHWTGELSTSALSTATAVSALQLVVRHDPAQSERLLPLIEGGVRYLTEHQNPDGGWGDTDRSYSNIATTMLAVAALTIAGRREQLVEPLAFAENYIEAQGGIAGLRRRYGKDKTFAVPILTNYALAGLVEWREVSPLPFELACLPQKFYKLVKLPVVSYAIPALVAIGQARYFHRPPWNPLMRGLRAAAVKKSLAVLQRMQPASGGYLEAAPLTSFVVMSLASIGQATHPVAQSGVQFLVDSAREDGSWPIDSNLANWVTTLSINALADSGEDVHQLDCLPWVLANQYQETHPFTGADPGGWGWTDLSGSVPDADDTPGAMLAIAHFFHSPSADNETRRQIATAAKKGARWLLDLQNSDGGWPTFCAGWGTQPFDRSGSDLTAHAIRALHAWRSELGDLPVERGIERGFRYLQKQQRDDGSWLPLWFGNQDLPDDENPIYGTVKVLLAYRDLGKMSTRAAQRGGAWLAARQNEDGGFGGGPSVPTLCGGGGESSVEETALAIEALFAAENPAISPEIIPQAVGWLCQRVEEGSYVNGSPIGFYFSKLWYYEKLYPRVMTVASLGAALQANASVPPAPETVTTSSDH